MRRLPSFQRKFTPPKYSPNYDEIQRRFDMLTHSFIMKCAVMVREVHQQLRINLANSQLVYQTMIEMSMKVAILPELSTFECELVQKNVAQMISQIANQIKDERMKLIENELKRKAKRNAANTKVYSDDERQSSMSRRDSRVYFNEKNDEPPEKVEHRNFVKRRATVFTTRFVGLLIFYEFRINFHLFFTVQFGSSDRPKFVPFFRNHHIRHI